MELWLRSRSMPVLVGADLGFLTIVLLIGDRAAAVPALLGGGSSMIGYSLLAPMILSTGLIVAFDGRHWLREQTSARTLWLLDAVLLIATWVFCGLGLLLLSLVGVTDEAARIGANLLIISGLGTVAVSWLRMERAVVVPVVVVLLTLSYPPFGTAAKFVRFLQPEAAPAWLWILSIATPAAAIASLRLSRSVTLPTAHQ
jgi:hypothetical protein